MQGDAFSDPAGVRGLLWFVAAVAQNREAGVREVDSDLVSAAGFHCEFEKCGVSQAVQDLVVGDGEFGVLPFARDEAVQVLARSQMRMERAFVTLHTARDDGCVSSLRFLLFELIDQYVRQFSVLAEHKQAADVAIQPVNDPRFFGSL